MNITTTYGSRANGSGIVVAKGGGKQKTVSFDPERTPGQNHGDAAGELLKSIVKPGRREFLLTTAKVTDELDNGKMRFGVSL